MNNSARDNEELPPKLEAFAELIAVRVREEVAELLEERGTGPPPLLDATDTAKYLGITPEAVRAMAASGRLPCMRLGNGARPRLRFDARAVAEVLAADMLDIEESP